MISLWQTASPMQPRRTAMLLTPTPPGRHNTTSFLPFRKKPSGKAFFHLFRLMLPAISSATAFFMTLQKHHLILRCSKIPLSVEFEPHATSLEAKGDGYVVASLGEDSGYVPYTAFSAKKSYIENNPEIIQAFTNALQKGMNYVQTHSAEKIATVIQPQFEETDLETITTIVERYAKQDTWKSDLIFEEESFDLLQNILEEAGELENRVPYEDLVNTTFAEEAAK